MLKKNLFFAAVIMLSMAACSKEDLCGCDEGIAPINDLTEVEFTGEITDMRSRVKGNRWTTDKIGIMATNDTGGKMVAAYKNAAYETNSEDLTATFTPVTPADAIYFPASAGIVTFAAYAPYVSSSGANTLPGTDGVITVNTQNNNNNETQQISINYLHTSGATASKEEPIVAFTDQGNGNDYSFKHSMSRLILKFKSSIADGFTGNEIFTTANGAYVLGGIALKGTFNAITGVAQANMPPIDQWDISNCIHTDDKGKKVRTYTLLVLPQEYTANEKLAVTITIGEKKYANTTTISANFIAGKSYTYTIILKKNGLEVSGSTITDWEEATPEEGAATI